MMPLKGVTGIAAKISGSPVSNGRLATPRASFRFWFRPTSHLGVSWSARRKTMRRFVRLAGNRRIFGCGK